MKYKKEVYISRKRNEIYYDYFDDSKPMTIYRFKNMTLYMNNDVGIDIVNTISKNVELHKFRRDLGVIQDYFIIKNASCVSHEYTSFNSNAYLFGNLKIFSSTRFKAYIIPPGQHNTKIVEFDIDMSHLLTFYDWFDVGFDNSGICIIKLLRKVPRDTFIYDVFKLDLDITKHDKITFSVNGIEPDIVTTECRHVYEEFLLRHI